MMKFNLRPLSLTLPMRHPIARLALRLPLSLPIDIMPARVGWDVHSYITISYRTNPTDR